ncbi:unnamed protein product [Victoria cruziana]
MILLCFRVNGILAKVFFLLFSSFPSIVLLWLFCSRCSSSKKKRGVARINTPIHPCTSPIRWSTLGSAEESSDYI